MEDANNTHKVVLTLVIIMFLLSLCFMVVSFMSYNNAENNLEGFDSTNINQAGNLKITILPSSQFKTKESGSVSLKIVK